MIYTFTLGDVGGDGHEMTRTMYVDLPDNVDHEQITKAVEYIDTTVGNFFWDYQSSNMPTEQATKICAILGVELDTLFAYNTTWDYAEKSWDMINEREDRTTVHLRYECGLEGVVNIYFRLIKAIYPGFDFVITECPLPTLHCMTGRFYGLFSK